MCQGLERPEERERDGTWGVSGAVRIHTALIDYLLSFLGVVCRGPKQLQ